MSTSWAAQFHPLALPHKPTKSKISCQNRGSPKFKKALQRFKGFLKYYSNYIPRLSERLSPFFKLLRETSKFYVPTNLVENFTNLKTLLENSCQLPLRLKDKQLKVMSDASFTAAGCAIMIEDDPNKPKNIRTYSIWFLKPWIRHKQNCQYMPKIFFQFTSLSWSLDTSCGGATSQSKCSPTTDQLLAFFKQNSLLQHFGTHAIMCCYTIS